MWNFNILTLTSLDISKRVSYNFCSFTKSAFSPLVKEWIIEFPTAPLSLRFLVRRHRFTVSFFLEKCVYSICFACGPKSVLRSISRIQSSLMYYCLPEPNATRVIKITKRNKTLSPITVRRRVEIKFSVESAFLYFVFCNKLVHVCGLTALRHKTTAWTMKPAQHIFVSIFGKSSIHTSWYVCVKQTEKVLFFSLKNGEVRYSGFNNCS